MYIFIAYSCHFYLWNIWTRKCGTSISRTMSDTYTCSLWSI